MQMSKVIKLIVILINFDKRMLLVNVCAIVCGNSIEKKMVTFVSAMPTDQKNPHSRKRFVELVKQMNNGRFEALF